MSIVPLLGFHEPISSFSHLITAVIFLIIGIKLIINSRGNLLRSSSIIIYVFCGVFLFSMSGVYHLLQKGTTSNYVLQILDHAGIYLMISGTFTPFQIILLRGYKRWLPLCAIWTLAITGLTLTAIFFSDMPEWLLLTFFISMGWMSIFTVWFIRKIHFLTVKDIFAGGILYTIGAITEYLRFPVIHEEYFGPHEIFHLFVSAAAIVHLYGIYKISTFPISDVLKVKVLRYPHEFKAYPYTENAKFIEKTDEKLRECIENWVKANYLTPYRPKEISYRYFDVDKVTLKDS